jgi:O-antigen/teichoic acid export membrane protein
MRVVPLAQASNTVDARPGVGRGVRSGAVIVPPPADERRAVVSTIGWSAAATLWTVAGRFAAGLICARVLGPERTGELVYLLWIVDVVVIASTFALPAAATRFVAALCTERHEADTVVAWLYRRLVWLVLIGGPVTAMCVSATAVGQRHGLMPGFVGLYFGALALHTYYVAVLAGRQAFRQLARVSMASSLLLVAGVTLGAVKLGVPGATAGYFAGALPGALLSLRCWRRPHGERIVAAATRARIAHYAFYTWMAALLSAFAWSRTEIFFIQRTSGEYWVAMFSVGISLATLAAQGPMLLTGPLLPHFAQLAGSGRLSVFNARYASAIRVLASLLFPLCLGLASLLPVLLPLAYGEKFAPAVPVAMVLVACAALAFTTVCTAALQALEGAWFIAAVSAIGAAASIGSGLLIIPHWGAWGAVWARAVIQTGMVVAGIVYLSRRFGLRFPGSAMGRLLGAALVSAACSGALVRVRPDLVGAAAAVAVGAVAYGICVRVLRAVPPQDLPLLTAAAQRLPSAVVPGVVAVLNAVTGGDRGYASNDVMPRSVGAEK